MQCIAYLETKSTTRHGKPYKNGKTRTSQMSTVRHVKSEEAKEKGWLRCDGTLQIHHTTYVAGSACNPYVESEIDFTCTKCRFKGGEWILDNQLDAESFIESNLQSHIDSIP
jgi:hypothetical protein